MNPTRRQLLAGGAALFGGAMLGFPRRAAAQAGPARRLITIFAQGGWDRVFALDPKEASPAVAMPAGQLRRAGGIDYFDAEASGGAVRTYFERHSDVTALVRGVTVRSISHPGCVKRILTGTASEASPDFGAITAHVHAADMPLPYMVLGSTAFSGPYAASTGRLGNANQLVTLLDPAKQFPPPGQRVADPTFVPDADDDAAISAWLRGRAERMRAQRGQFGSNRRKLDAYLSSLENSRRLRAYSDGMGAPTLAIRFDAQIELALTMLSEEVCWSTSIATGLPWDSHTNNEQSQGANHRLMFEGLTALMDALKSTPSPGGGMLIDDTAVAVISEMGRTPTLNPEAGKDHWQTTACMLMGAGLTGDRVYGASTNGDDGPALESAPVDFATGRPAAGGQLLESSALVAGILQWVGVDPASYLPGGPVFAPFVA